MSQYPKWIYHKKEAAKIVRSKEEHEKHGPEWKESPAHFEVEEVKSEEPKKKGKYK